MRQGQRTHALQSIRDGRVRVCIATDVAARGIDLPNLDLVIHADLPKNSDSLLHRSGRTGRAGRKGTTALIVPHNARKRTERLFQRAKINASWSNAPTVHEISLRDDERILQDPVLTAPLKEKEHEFVKRLLATQSAEQIAGAFIRLYRSGQSAPEEISDTIFEEDRPRRNDSLKGRSSRKNSRDGRDSSRDAFQEGIWFSLSVGRKHTAEARWLLPAIIRAGNLNKRDVGAIKIEESQTFFEIASESAEKFMEALGPSRKLEKSMSVNRIGDYPKILKEREQGADPHDQRRKTIKTSSQDRKTNDKRMLNKKVDNEGKEPGGAEEKLNYSRKARQNVISQENSEEFIEAANEEKVVISQPGGEGYSIKRAQQRDADQKPGKSKKVRKNKGKRSRRVVSSVNETKRADFKRGPKLKLAKVAGKQRARVTRKTVSHPEPGSAPLKRKN